MKSLMGLVLRRRIYVEGAKRLNLSRSWIRKIIYICCGHTYVRTYIVVVVIIQSFKRDKKALK